MRRLRFFASAGSLEGGAGTRVILPAEESEHLRLSLRARAGLDLFLFDGEGSEYRARVSSVREGRVEAELLEPELGPVEPGLRVIALQALSQGARFEAAVDQMTSLGVGRIVPLLTERGRRGRGSEARRLERWRRIAREASKLSWRRVVPVIDDPMSVDELPRLAPPETIGLLLETSAPPGSLHRLLESRPPREVWIAIGPEGGFSPAELGKLRGAGYSPVHLGPRVLRTEHAGAAALAVVLSRWADLG